MPCDTIPAAPLLSKSLYLLGSPPSLETSTPTLIGQFLCCRLAGVCECVLVQGPGLLEWVLHFSTLHQAHGSCVGGDVASS